MLWTEKTLERIKSNINDGSSRSTLRIIRLGLEMNTPSGFRGNGLRFISLEGFRLGWRIESNGDEIARTRLGMGVDLEERDTLPLFEVSVGREEMEGSRVERKLDGIGGFNTRLHNLKHNIRDMRTGQSEEDQFRREREKEIPSGGIWR